MLKEIIIGLLSITTIVGIIAFFIKQGIWTRYIQPLVSRKPKYDLRFDNGQDIIRVQLYEALDLERLVAESMRNEQMEHPYERFTSPSYEYPFPELFEGPSTNKKIYNELLDSYLKEKETEYRNRHNGELEDDFMIPVQIMLHNGGSVPSGKISLHLTIEPTGQVYLVDAREEKSGDTIEPPMCMPEGVFPLLAYNRVAYQYVKWNFAKPVTKTLDININFLNHHSKNDYDIPVFYIDSRKECRINIKANIIDSSVLEPFEREAVIIVDPLLKQ